MSGERIRWDAVLVAPGVAPSASALHATPSLALRDGQLLVVEHSQTTAGATLRQVVERLVLVPVLGLAIVQTGDELYLLPLAGLTIR